MPHALTHVVTALEQELTTLRAEVAAARERERMAHERERASQEREAQLLALLRQEQQQRQRLLEAGAPHPGWWRRLWRGRRTRSVAGSTPASPHAGP